MFKNTSNSNIMTYQNYLVKDGQAVPENPFDYDSTVEYTAYERFETWKQSHTYATDAKDGSWPVERFEKVKYQVLIDLENYTWQDVSKETYKSIIADNKYRHFMKQRTTREFAKFKEEVEKPKESEKLLYSKSEVIAIVEYAYSHSTLPAKVKEYLLSNQFLIDHKL